MNTELLIDQIGAVLDGDWDELDSIMDVMDAQTYFDGGTGGNTGSYC
jgi:hypothetical protein